MKCNDKHLADTGRQQLKEHVILILA